MIRTLALALLLAGCSAPAPSFPDCPGPVPIPAALRKHEGAAALEVRVELAREAERARGDACADAVRARDAWIRRSR